jgi:DNA-binding SARP family transcriptional activator/TolB-like protein
LFSLTLFGGVRLGGPSGSVEGYASQRRQLALLALLTTAGSQGRSREKLQTLLSPESPTDAARHSLANAIYRLRTTLGEDCIQGEGELLRLNPAVVRADVTAFEAHLDRSELEEAVELYRGPFMDGFHLKGSSEFEDWRSAEARRLGQRFEEALEKLAVRAQGEGEWRRAAGHWERLSRHDPFNTRFALGRMQALAKAGDPGNAIYVGEEHSRLLRDELDAEASPELTAHLEGLRAGEWSARGNEGGRARAPEEVPAALAKIPVAAERAEMGPRRARRLGALAAAGVIVVALGAAWLWGFRDSGTPLPGSDVREPVVVLPFEVQGSDPELAHVGVQAAHRIAAAIEGANLGRVVDYRPEGGGQAYSERWGRRVVRETGAGTLVRGVIAQRGGEVEMQARVVRASDLSTVWTLGPERGSVGDPTPVLDALLDRVLGAVGLYLSPMTEGWTAVGLFEPPPSLEVFRMAGRGWELFGRARYDEAAPLLREAFARDTTWLPAALWLGTTYSNLNRWHERDSVWAFLEARRERLYPGDALRADMLRAWGLGSPEEGVRAARNLFSAQPIEAYNVMLALVRARRGTEALDYYSHRDTVILQHRTWQAWDAVAARAYHMLGRFEEELALARAGKGREPRYYLHWEREVRALGALGRVPEIEELITESHGLEIQGAPVRLMSAAAQELSLHGWPEEARAYAERAVEGALHWPDSLRPTAAARNLHMDMLRILGRQAEVVAIYDEQSRRLEAGGLHYRILAMRDRILLGDTVGALALVDSARTQPISAFVGSGWPRAAPLYHGAHILSLLGRGDEAVALLREAMNNGWRLGADEPLQWYWAPIKDHPPFQELVKVR